MLFVAQKMLSSTLNDNPVEGNLKSTPRQEGAAQAAARQGGPRALMVAALAAFVLLATTALAGPRLPEGVPDVLDPHVQRDYQPYQVGNLEGNPDFPVVLFMSRGGEKPAVLLAVDARNGRESWSVASDPVILVAVFSDPQRMTGLFLDTGFAERGEASGSFSVVTDLDRGSLPHVLKAVAAARAQIYM